LKLSVVPKVLKIKVYVSFAPGEGGFFCFYPFLATYFRQGKVKNILHYSVKRYTGVAVRQSQGLPGSQ
jgi:hypothetical protein